MANETSKNAKDNTNESKGTEQQESEQAQSNAPEMGEVITSDETEQGTVQISENVIAAIVRKYTLEVDGVLRFANSSFVGGLAEIIGRKQSESSVVVNLEGDSVEVAVTIVVRFGVKIPEVATLVQDVITSKVEELTGKHVGKVNVIVHDVEEPQSETTNESGEKTTAE